jgi:hypothetical protein
VWNNLHKKLLQKNMTRKEFLQLIGGSVVVLFGFSNLIALVEHLSKTTTTADVNEVSTASHGFGSRKFGA